MLFPPLSFRWIVIALPCYYTRMNTMNQWVVATMCLCFSCGAAFGQAEVSAWGGLRGIRIDGALMAFTTGLRAIGSTTPSDDRRGEMLGNAHYLHEGSRQICTGGLRAGDLRRGFAYVFRAPANWDAGWYLKMPAPARSMLTC